MTGGGATEGAFWGVAAAAGGGTEGVRCGGGATEGRFVGVSQGAASASSVTLDVGFFPSGVGGGGKEKIT